LRKSCQCCNQSHIQQHTNINPSFLSWYYYVAPNHNTYTLARRTMTLANFAAFFVFAFYPCMPPRLLPESYGFQDTVRQENAESVWVKAGTSPTPSQSAPPSSTTRASSPPCSEKPAANRACQP
jgi:hypothetical protein